MSAPDGTVVTGGTTTVGSVAGLRAMRHAVADWLDELGVDVATFIADVQLAAVEIVTNAFVHDGASHVQLTVAIVEHDVIVTTEHDAIRSGPIDLPGLLPSPDSVSGRGLYLVDQIARARSHSVSDGVSRTRLEIPVPLGTGHAQSSAI